jgi:energy-coupling factor transporter transmembrane protein EcfT
MTENDILGGYKMDYKRNKKYFIGSAVSDALIEVGIVFLMFGVIFTVILNLLSRFQLGFIWFTIFLIVVGLGFVVSGLVVKGRKIKDSEIDQICQQQISNIKKAALNKLGIDEDEVKEANPIIVGGYRFDDKENNVLYKKGADGLWRSSEYQITLIFFSREQVYSFIRIFSIISDEKFDKTQEYFYRDIVSVSTEQRKVTYKPPGAIKKAAPQTATYEYFDLASSGGTHMIGFFKKSDSEDIDRSIIAMRNLLKDKKQVMA